MHHHLAYCTNDRLTTIQYPGALYMLSIFYTRKEIATRISILYTGSKDHLA